MPVAQGGFADDDEPHPAEDNSRIAQAQRAWSSHSIAAGESATRLGATVSTGSMANPTTSNSLGLTGRSRRVDLLEERLRGEVDHQLPGLLDIA
ncbi:MAG: hypothetical protein H0T54_03420 [Geodermatophilaceae bacterium]|nr:hypothetical protein [Geodermatophilaceae bacterium]